MARVLLPSTHFYRAGLGGSGRLLWNVDAVRLTMQASCWG